MSVRPWRDIARRQSRQIMVGNVPVGGDAPVTVQTMTNTPTSDAARDDRPDPPLRGGRASTSSACPAPTSRAPRRSKQIVRASRVPIVADIHFHYKRALEAADAGAACLRINPGNIGSAERVNEVVNAAKANGCAIRIGVNAGSLEKRSAREIWRAVPRGAGRERARSYQAAPGPRLPRITRSR